MSTKPQRLDEQFPLNSRDPIRPELRRFIGVVEVRLSALESQRADFEDAINALSQSGIQRVNAVLVGVAERVAQLTTVGALFTGLSNSVVHVVLGRQEITLTSATRGNFAAPRYVSVVNIDEPRVSIGGVTQSYDPETGGLVIDVHQASMPNPPITPSTNWIVCAAAPPALPSIIDGGTFEGVSDETMAIGYVTDLFDGTGGDTDSEDGGTF